MEPIPFSPLACQYESLLLAAFPNWQRSGGMAEDSLLPMDEGETPELVWQSRWFAGNFGREFISVDGQSVRIVQFGHWNHGPGPDFQECAVEIDGRLHRGCLELDPEDRDWERHGHHVNAAYEEVVLHVFLKSGSSRRFTRTASHRNIPQVLLSPVPSMFPVEASPPQPAAKPGRCQQQILRSWPAARIDELLQAAARYRLDTKAANWQRLATLHGPAEAHFQCLAECLGYRHNKLPMLVLAQQFPLAMLRRRPAMAEAWLFGASGFLDKVSFDASDPPTRAYLRRLWEAWWQHRAAWKDSPHYAALPWATGAVRPANHPQRRVAALAALAGNWDKLAPLLPPEGFQEKPLIKALEALSHSYWDHHYTLTAAPGKSRIALLGRTRVFEMLANVIYPAVVHHQADRWSAYCELKSQLENEKSKLAALRLFGEGELATRHTRFLYQQQGLLQIFQDFCLQDATDCQGCPFPEQIVQQF